MSIIEGFHCIYANAFSLKAMTNVVFLEEKGHCCVYRDKKWSKNNGHCSVCIEGKDGLKAKATELCI